MVFLKEILKKLILKKISRLQKAIKITQRAKSLGLLQTVGTQGKARIFLLVDLREKFSDLGSGGRRKKIKKTLKMTS